MDKKNQQPATVANPSRACMRPRPSTLRLARGRPMIRPISMEPINAPQMPSRLYRDKSREGTMLAEPAHKTMPMILETRRMFITKPLI